MPAEKLVMNHEEGYIGALTLWYAASGDGIVDYEAAKVGEAAGEVWVLRFYQNSHGPLDPVRIIVPLERIVVMSVANDQSADLTLPDAEFFQLA